MTTYVLPQVQVFQDLERVPAVESNPMSAYLAGGNAALVRWAELAERPLGMLGLYDHLTAAQFNWPNQPSNSIIDEDYTKLFVQNAMLRYFTDLVGSPNVTTRVAGSFNRIRANSLVFTTANGFNRSAGFYDRDVRIGDVVRVAGTPTAGVPTVLDTHVTDLVADVIPSVVGSAGLVVGNQATALLATSLLQTAGLVNCMTAVADGTAYSGLAAGRVSETYVVEVIQASTGNNLPTGLLRVTSASGTDNVAAVVPSADGVPTPIGTRGLEVTFSYVTNPPCEADSIANSVAPDALLLGQQFTITVQQDFTATTATAGGTYTGAEDATYLITVTRGGDFADNPEIFVGTVTGSDMSGPIVVPGLATPVAIGTRGVTLEFGGSVEGLHLGDRFTVTATAASSGPVRTLVLADNLDPGFLTTDEVAISLFIREPALPVPANRTNFAPLTNWSQSQADVTVQAGITVYHPTWTNAGVPLPLPVESSSPLNYGVLHLEYRAWLSTLSSQILSIYDVSQLDDIPGPLSPDNPLKWGMFSALANNNGVPVLCTAVANPDLLDSWQDIFDLLLSTDDAYGLVPLTRDPAVLALFTAHVNSTSDPLTGLWRTAWYSLPAFPERPLVHTGTDLVGYAVPTTTDSTEALATFSEFGSSGQFTVLQVPANNARFISNEVRVGDTVRALYIGDGFGGSTYTTFTVSQVISESELRLTSGPAVAQPVPTKIEVWRTLSLTEEAQEIARVAGTYSSRRIRATLPDQIESAGTAVAGWFLNCALAALASAVLPQQGLTNVAINGFSSVSRTTRFSRSQLDLMAGSGVWIVTQANSGEIFTRHAVTTGNYSDINDREESITRNLDNISYRFKDYLAPFIGVTNVTPSMEETIRGGIVKLLRTMQSERSTPQLGGQVIDGTLERFFVSELFRDRYVAYLRLQLPYALNTIELHLIA